MNMIHSGHDYGISRRDFMAGAAACVGAFAQGCSSLTSKDLSRYEDDLIDRCWMWGHETGQVDGLNNHWGLDPAERYYHMVEGAKSFGLHNLNVIRWDLPDLAFRDTLRGMKRVTWPMSANTVEKHFTYAELGDYGFKAADESANVTGFELDDYFKPKKKDVCWADTPRGRVRVCPSVYPYSDLVALRRRIDAYGRPLELRLVVYDQLFEQREDPRDLLPVIELATTCTYWVWNGRNLSKLGELFRRYRELVPSKPTFLGVYLYDFGSHKAMSPELLEGQLATGLELFRRGEIEGFVFLCSSICNRRLPAVEIARAWIAAHADEKWGTRRMHQ